MVPSIEEYMVLAGSYDLIPVCEEIFIDLDTPVSIYAKLAGISDSPSYLLESVDGGEQLGRYSFIGYDPFLTLKAEGGNLAIDRNGMVQIIEDGNPVDCLREIMAECKVRHLEGGLRFFGGGVGYLGYETVFNYETISHERQPDAASIPDCFFIFTKLVLVFDHVKHRLKIIAFIPMNGNPQLAYKEAIDLIGQVKQRIAQGPASSAGFAFTREAAAPAGVLPPGVQTNITREEFLANVSRAKEYITAGDIFQVVLSQRFELDLHADAFEVYRALRCINPSPYMYFLDFGGFSIAGSSPEMLVRVEDGRVETHPIAGTRQRGKDKAADDALAQELLQDAKERAEHVMLVDLGRNDVGKVSKFGTVVMKRFMEVERYSHVMHMVSSVQGELDTAKDSFEALKACFPAGTVSGAPKVRAMQIIEELETTGRGPYAGAIAYVGFNGNLDSCITIRTVLAKDGKAYIQAGGGIVVDSEPQKEYEESINKATAVIAAVKMAQGGD